MRQSVEQFCIAAGVVVNRCNRSLLRLIALSVAIFIMKNARIHNPPTDGFRLTFVPRRDLTGIILCGWRYWR
ncbi:MAG: hypothetical protein GXP08_13885 [Gammaproteobacteria bacterium]|nr:hypothetical protein [Gammaproteobacteria bacterium]